MGSFCRQFCSGCLKFGFAVTIRITCRTPAYGFLTKYHGSLNDPSQANEDFREEIFARRNPHLLANDYSENHDILSKSHIQVINLGFLFKPFCFNIGYSYSLISFVSGNMRDSVRAASKVHNYSFRFYILHKYVSLVIAHLSRRPRRI